MTGTTTFRENNSFYRIKDSLILDLKICSPTNKRTEK